MDFVLRGMILRLRQANHTRRFYALSTGEARYLNSSPATTRTALFARAAFLQIGSRPEPISNGSLTRK